MNRAKLETLCIMALVSPDLALLALVLLAGGCV